MNLYDEILSKDQIGTRFATAINAILVEKLAPNKASLAEALGVKPSKFSEILNGRMRAGTDMIARMCDLYNVSPDWIMMGRGDKVFRDSKPPKYWIDDGDLDTTPFKEDDVTIEKENADEPVAKVIENPETALIGQPYYDVDFMGGWLPLGNDQTNIPAKRIWIEGFDRVDLWCNVTGHSMEPQISHGDIIGLRKCTVDNVLYGETYAVVLNYEIRTIKIIRRSNTPGMLRYVPINKEYDEQEFPINAITHIYEVVGAVKRFF